MMDRKHTDTAQSNPDLYAQYPKAVYRDGQDGVESAIVYTPEEHNKLGKEWRTHPVQAYCEAPEPEEEPNIVTTVEPDLEPPKRGRKPKVDE